MKTKIIAQAEIDTLSAHEDVFTDSSVVADPERTFVGSAVPSPRMAILRSVDSWCVSAHEIRIVDDQVCRLVADGIHAADALWLATMGYELH